MGRSTNSHANTAAPPVSASEHQPQDPPGRRGMVNTSSASATGSSSTSAATTAAPVTPPEEPVPKYIPPHKLRQYRTTVEDATDSSESSVSGAEGSTTKPARQATLSKGKTNATVPSRSSAPVAAASPTTPPRRPYRQGPSDGAWRNTNKSSGTSAPAPAPSPRPTYGPCPPLDAHAPAFTPAGPSHAAAPVVPPARFGLPNPPVGTATPPIFSPSVFHPPLWHYAIPAIFHATPPALPTTPMTLEQCMRLHRIFTFLTYDLSTSAYFLSQTINEVLSSPPCLPDYTAFVGACAHGLGDAYRMRVLSGVAKTCDEQVMRGDFACVRDAVKDFTVGCVIDGLPLAEDRVGRELLTAFYTRVYYAATVAPSGASRVVQVPGVFDEWFTSMDDGVLGEVVGMYAGNRRVLGWLSIFQNDEQPWVNPQTRRRDPCLCCARR